MLQLAHSTNYIRHWEFKGIDVRFANALLILLDIPGFPQPNESVSTYPVDFGRVEES